MKQRIVFRTIGVVFAVLAIIFIGTTSAIYFTSRQDNAQPADAIIVLGARQVRGIPSPVFQARLDHALMLFQGGYTSNIILTGGIGEGETISEAEVGRQYLLSKGVKAENIKQENSGRTTWQSMQSAAQIASDHGWQSVILVSDGFHLLRAKKMASDLGLKSYTSPTQTSPITQNKSVELKYILRENSVFWAYIIFGM